MPELDYSGLFDRRSRFNYEARAAVNLCEGILVVGRP
jgi:hypothetical protein